MIATQQSRTPAAGTSGGGQAGRQFVQPPRPPPRQTPAPSGYPAPQKRQFAKLPCVAFGHHAQELESVVPGRCYILVVACEQGRPGFPDDLVVRSISEAPSLDKHLARPRTGGGRQAPGQGPGGPSDPFYDRRDAEPGPSYD